MGVSAGVGALIIDLALLSLLCGFMNFQVLVFAGTRQASVDQPVDGPSAGAMTGQKGAGQPLGHKITVLWMWIMGMLQYCFFIHATYYMAMNHETGRTPFPWSIQSQLFFVTLTAMTSKLLFTLRIFKLSRYLRSGKLLCFVLLAVQFVEYAFGFVIAASLLSVHWLEDLARFEVTWAAWGSMSMAIVTDVTIAVVLAFTLVKSSPNLSWTNSSSVMLCAYVLNSGALPAILSILVLISFTQGPASAMFLAIEGVLPQLHINVLLAMLNARSYLQSARQLNPAIFYIPTSDNSGVIFQPPPGHHRHHSSFAYGNEYHVRSFGNGGDVEDNGETINELGLPLFKLPSYKVGEEGKKRKERKPGTPNSTATTVAPTGAREGEKDEVDRMFDDLGLQRHRTTPTATPYASPTNSNSAPEPLPTPLPVNIPLEVRVQTTKQATYTSYSRPSSNGRGRWLGR